MPKKFKCKTKYIDHNTVFLLTSSTMDFFIYFLIHKNISTFQILKCPEILAEQENLFLPSFLFHTVYAK